MKVLYRRASFFVARGTWIILVPHSLLVILPDAHGTAFMSGKLWWGVFVSARVEFFVCIVLFVVLGG